MSNTITNDRFNKSDYLKLSNGATDVLINVLILSGSSLAQTQWQKELMVFLSLNDQQIKGLGCVGFDIYELGWKGDNFKGQKEFILRVIDDTLMKMNWEMLNYKPQEELIFSNLRRFREMIVNFSEDLVKPNDLLKWTNFFNTIKFNKCDKHKVYMHPFGCKICRSE
jgi:hypothetical protein